MSKLSKTSPIYFSAQKATIDLDAGVIRNCVMCMEGEADGHDVHLDSEFIAGVVRSAQEYGDKGVKARFGHPAMSNDAIGTYVGVFKNARVEGTRALADVHISDASSISPNGDYKSYILKMAKEEPDHISLSIVYRPGRRFQKRPDGTKIFRYKEVTDEDGNVDQVYNKEWDHTKPVFVEMKTLFNCDFVDEGAATKGLFSSKLNADKLAVQVTEFLDDHPEIWGIVDKNPETFSGFFTRYAKHNSEKTGIDRILTRVFNYFSKSPKMKDKYPRLAEIMGAEFEALTGNLSEEKLAELEASAKSKTPQAAKPEREPDPENTELSALKNSNKELLAKIQKQEDAIKKLSDAAIAEHTELSEGADTAISDDGGNGDYLKSEAYANSTTRKFLQEMGIED